MIPHHFVDSGKFVADNGRENFLKLALEISELHYRRLFETAQEGILIVNANTGEIIDVNPFLLDLLDYPLESMIGLRFWEIGHFQAIAANQAAFETLARNEYFRNENLPLRSKAGKETQVDFVNNVYLVGFDKVMQCSIRDIRSRESHQASHAVAKADAKMRTGYPPTRLVKGKIEVTAYPQGPGWHKPKKRSKSSTSQFAKTTDHLIIKGIKPQEAAANMRASLARFARLSIIM
jgi:PAS domain S-box-containing protein